VRDTMDFSAKLENLKAKVDEIVTTAQAAAAEDRDNSSSASIRHRTMRISLWRMPSSEVARLRIEPRASGRR
jgi:hypothetical protein